MNDKLTIQELAAYLPHKLKVVGDGKIKVMNAYCGHSINWIGLEFVIKHSDRIKPLLLPLSIVTTEFCKIHDIDFTHRFWGDIYFNEGSDKEGCSDYFTFKDAQILAKYHIDLFNLIPRGLAIDKTTIQ